MYRSVLVKKRYNIVSIVSNLFMGQLSVHHFHITVGAQFDEHKISENSR